MTTPREMDALLAEAIGCKVEDRWNGGFCTCEADTHGKRGSGFRVINGHPCSPVLPYYSAPTWETTGQLIEGLAQLPFDGLLASNAQRRFDEILAAEYWPSSLTPARIAEAARIALGLPLPDEVK